MSGPVVVVGDVLLDVDVVGEVHRTTPDAGVPVLEVTGESARPGGAGLAAQLLAATGPVVLVGALAADEPAKRLSGLLHPAVTLLAGPAGGGTPVKCRWLQGSRPLLRSDSGTGCPADDFGPTLADRLPGVLADAGAVLVSDYGRGVAADPVVRAALTHAVDRGVPVVWDPHPRGARPVPGVTVATPNLAEARLAAEQPSGSPDAVGRLVRELWSSTAIAVTVGAGGAVLVRADGEPVAVPAPTVDGGDPCGAGDAFAGALARRLAGGAEPADAVGHAVRVAAEFVGAGGAASVGVPAQG